MAKTIIEYTNDEKKLYTLLEKEVKKANSRITKLEKLGIKDGFALKQLRDYLNIDGVQALTKTGKISLRGGYNLTQLLAIQRATQNFLDDVSTLNEINQLKNQYEKILGKKLNLKQVNTLYRARKDYSWIYEYITPSEFWSVWAPLAKQLDMDSWVEELLLRIDNFNDVELKEDLKALYIYVKGD